MPCPARHNPSDSFVSDGGGAGCRPAECDRIGHLRESVAQNRMQMRAARMNHTVEIIGFEDATPEAVQRKSKRTNSKRTKLDQTGVSVIIAKCRYDRCFEIARQVLVRWSV